MKLWDKIIELWRKFFKKDDAPQTNDIDLSNADWKKINGRSAKTTETLKTLGMIGDDFVYSFSDGVRDWLPMSNGCNQYACFFIKRGETYIGGKFEWARPSSTTRNIKNIVSGYTDGIIPNSGETVWFCLISLDCTRRTNCLSVKWR